MVGSPRPTWIASVERASSFDRPQEDDDAVGDVAGRFREIMGYDGIQWDMIQWNIIVITMIMIIIIVTTMTIITMIILILVIYIIYIYIIYNPLDMICDKSPKKGLGEAKHHSFSSITLCLFSGDEFPFIENAK